MTNEQIDDPAEAAFCRFDARKKGYSEWKGRPQSERDAFKAEYRIAVVAPAQPAIQEERAGMSIGDEDRFKLLTYAIYQHGLHKSGSGDREVHTLADFIDVKLAQAREEGRRDTHEEKMTIINTMLKATERAEKAEQQLAAIRAGVEGLARNMPTNEPKHMEEVHTKYGYVWLDDVRELIPTPPQPDTSGLPG